jgi:UDP:flavonoid glycosyltransferase YjiC (YdhE family)
LAQAIAAGVPQLVHRMSTDQPDNAYRVVRAACQRWAKQASGPAAIRLVCGQVELLSRSAIAVA